MGHALNALKRLRRKEAQSNREPGAFVPLPLIVLGSSQFANLSAHAVKLFFDLLSQWRFGRNGDLCATWSVMEKRGWRSRDTLGKALHELLEKRFIVQTRQGGLHSPNLYAVTIMALDPSPKLDMLERDFPRSAWSKVPVTPKPRRTRQHAGRANASAINTANVTPRVAQAAL